MYGVLHNFDITLGPGRGRFGTGIFLSPLIEWKPHGYASFPLLTVTQEDESSDRYVPPLQNHF